MTDHVDPTAANLARFGIARTSRGGAIRAKCMDCVGTAHEIRLCVVSTCALWPFRLGDDPWREKREMTDEQRARLAAQLARGREARG